MNTFSEYYTNQFEHDLNKWFNVQRGVYGPYKCNFIAFAAEHDIERPMKCSDSTEHEYFFSIACFYTFLTPLAVTLASGNKDAKYLFSKASGRPLISCGMGGFMSPAKALEEADIAPLYPERKKYHPKLVEQLPFFQDEVKGFLQGNAINLNADAYAQICKITEGKINEILQLMEREVNHYVDFLTGKIDHFNIEILPDELKQ